MAIKKEVKLTKGTVVKGLALVLGESYTGVDGIVRRKGNPFPLDATTSLLLKAVDDKGVPYFKEVDITDDHEPTVDDDDLDDDNLGGTANQVTV